MLTRLLSRNVDWANLAAEGYHLDFVANHLVVRNVPFLDANQQVRKATLVSTVDVDVDFHAKAKDHTMWFRSDPPNLRPCGLDGQPLKHMGGTDQARTLAEGLEVDRMFSAKRHDQQSYEDLHQKVTRYWDILTAPVEEVLKEAVRPGPPLIYAETDVEMPFEFLDTASTRSEIMGASQKLEGQRLAIIGTGGSGAYLLDFVAKTPVKSIKLFDGDEVKVHNAFRFPGAPTLEQLRAKPSKVDYLHGVYSRMKKGITKHGYLREENLSEMEGTTYAFLCIDKPEAKPPIMAYLRQHGIPFTDVGLGLSLTGTSVRGSVGITTIRPGEERALANIATVAEPDDVYRSNIQVAELNALAAAYAVLRWKKHLGFYVDDLRENNTEYLVRNNELSNETENTA